MIESKTAGAAPANERCRRTIDGARDVCPEWIDHDAIVVLDLAGRVTACNSAAAALLGRPAGAVSGHAVSSLISGLPFAAETPGYNLAFASLHGAQDSWLSGAARLADGDPIAIDVALTCAKRADGHFIFLMLRPSTPATS